MRVGLITFFVMGAFISYLACERWGYTSLSVPLISTSLLFLVLYLRDMAGPKPRPEDRN